MGEPTGPGEKADCGTGLPGSTEEPEGIRQGVGRAWACSQQEPYRLPPQPTAVALCPCYKALRSAHGVERALARRAHHGTQNVIWDVTDMDCNCDHTSWITLGK